LAKYTSKGLPLEQHQKIEKKKKRKNTTSYLIDIWQVWMQDGFCKDIYYHLFQMAKDIGPE
jgi:hypothetical protein